MRTVNATVDGQIALHDLDAGVVSRLRRALSFPNPEYQNAVRFGEEPDGSIPERLCCVTELADGSVCVPRGTVYEVRALLGTRGFEVKFQNERSKGQPLDCGPIRKPLRDYQSQAAANLLLGLQGTIVLPCGAGKTTCGIGAIAMLQRTTLILVHTIDLVKQWAGSIEEFLGVTPAIFAGGKHDLGPITIATLQSLMRSDVDLSGFGFCIHDECHRAPASTSQAVLRRVPAHWRLGLTATPQREDGKTKMVEWSFGELLLQRTVPELVEAGWLVLPSVATIETAFNFACDEDTPDRVRINRLAKAVVRSESRNTLLADTIARETNGNTSLVLSNNKEHCEKLRQLLVDRGLDPVVITSDVGKKKRQAMLAGLRDGTIGLAIATSLADEGLDVPRLSRVFLALPERARGRTTQRAGRLMRPFGDKRARIFDFIDVNVDTLMSRWRSRRSVYRKLGLEIHDC